MATITVIKIRGESTTFNLRHATTLHDLWASLTLAGKRPMSIDVSGNVATLGY